MSERHGDPHRLPSREAATEPPEDEQKVMLGVRIPASLKRRLKMLSVRSGESMASLTTDALEELLWKREG